MSKTRVLFVGLLVAAFAGCGGDDGEKRHFVSIGTGSVDGVYYPVGSAIAKLVNAKEDEYGVNMSVQSTGGSVFNVNAVLVGDLDFGITQSDRQHQAYKGLAEWEDDGPQTKLRAVCSLHPEAVTLVAAVDAGIESLADLKGKTVNLGNPGSGNRGNALDVLRAAGLDPEDDLNAESNNAGDSPDMLKDRKIDAFFYTVGHPAGAIKRASAGLGRAVRIVPITGMDELLASRSYYRVTEIRVDGYPRIANKAPVPTIGVLTTVVTSADVSDEVVYAMTKELFTNLDEFKKVHSATADLTAEGMLKGLSAPIHPGAMKYYKEAGLIK